MQGLIRLLIAGAVGVLAVATLFFFLVITLPIMVLRTLFGLPRKTPANRFFRRPGEPSHGPVEPRQSDGDDVIDIRAEVISTRDAPARSPSDG